MNPGRFLTAAMIVFALVVVPMATYVGGYYGLQSASTSVGKGSVVRFYSHRWQANIFKPAGRIEAWRTGRAVYIESLEDVIFE
jgi:hypothetical protein